MRFHGTQSRAATEAIARAAWVQAVPSRWAEPFGLVAVEAMMRGTAVVAAASAAPAASAPAATGLPIDVRVGGTQLVNGKVDFTDRFVRPNYSARLTELNGQVSALRSGTREMATITLKGRAADTALVDISGQLNPTAQPLALDIRAKATDLELAPLSPYAGKYAGYAIERGKLSMDLAYKISPEGQLQAKNKVIVSTLVELQKLYDSLDRDLIEARDAATPMNLLEGLAYVTDIPENETPTNAIAGRGDQPDTVFWREGLQRGVCALQGDRVVESHVSVLKVKEQYNESRVCCRTDAARAATVDAVRWR